MQYQIILKTELLLIRERCKCLYSDQFYVIYDSSAIINQLEADVKSTARTEYDVAELRDIIRSKNSHN